MKKFGLIRVALAVFASANVFGQSNVATATQKPERPAHAPQPTPEDVKARIAHFKAARATFLATQRELSCQMKNASQEEQDRIRAELRDERQQFRAQAKEIGQQTREAVGKADADLVRKLATEERGNGRRR